MRNEPGERRSIRTEVLASLGRLEELGKESHVKAHALLWAAPAHAAFAVLEADNLVAIGRYLNSIAITQEFTITPVQNVSDVVEFGKAALARAKR